MKEYTLQNYIQLLSSAAPAPGGGAAASLSGAMGIALVSMVANLTAGKKKYSQHEPLMQETLAASEKLIQSFMDCMEEDVNAFGAVSEAYQLPNNTEKEKKHRSTAIQKALQGALIPPYQIMAYALEALSWANQMLGTSNVNVVSDVGVAAAQLEAAVKSGWLNVLINLNSIKDTAFQEKYEQKARQMLAEAARLANEIYEKVVEEINA